MLGQFFSIFALNICSILNAGGLKDQIINCYMCFSGVLLYGQPFQWCKRQTFLFCYLLFLKSLSKSVNLLNNFWLSPEIQQKHSSLAKVQKKRSMESFKYIDLTIHQCKRKTWVFEIMICWFMLASAHTLPARRKGVYWGWERVLATDRGKVIGSGEILAGTFFFGKYRQLLWLFYNLWSLDFLWLMALWTFSRGTRRKKVGLLL